MRPLIGPGLLAGLLLLSGCGAYRSGSGGYYSPGCYSCGRSHEYDHGYDHHREREHRGGREHHGGDHHHHRDRDDDHRHH